MPSAVDVQLERRRQRAREEVIRVVNTGDHPVYSVFEVESVSDRTYRVQIHSIDELRNTCTCPDYRTNLIGSCKHIEAVLLYLKRKHGKKLPERAGQRPPGTRIYLHTARP